MDKWNLLEMHSRCNLTLFYFFVHIWLKSIAKWNIHCKSSWNNTDSLMRCVVEVKTSKQMALTRFARDVAFIVDDLAMAVINCEK